MLGWLFPRPPVRVQEKAWIEYRLAWLVEKLGAKRLLDAEVILPTDEFFPDDYHGEPADAEAMYRRVCGLMKVNPDEMNFELLPEDDLPGAAGHYDHSEPGKKPTLRVADSQIFDPQALVATLAHEIAHHILLGGGLLTGEEDDHELTTDLLPCVLGLGIFTANSTIRISSGSSGSWQWWNAQRSGYMPSHWIGYALALFVWLREDRSPRWSRHLRLDASEPLTRGLRYLRRTHDCYITPESLGPARKRSHAELAECLRRGTLSARIHALWDLWEHPDGKTLSNEVLPLLSHRDSAIRSAAIETAAVLEIHDTNCLREIAAGLHDPAYEVRTVAAKALGALLPEDDTVVKELGFALHDEASEVAFAAANALWNYGKQAAIAEKSILTALHDALIDCSYTMIDLLLDVLRKASPDPGQSINDYFRERDPEFRQVAIDALYSGNEDEP